MNFLIAETFTDSLARLTGEEQKAVKTTGSSPDLKLSLFCSCFIVVLCAS